MVATLHETLRKHENAVLFVGGRHLSGLTEEESLRPSDWNDLLSAYSSTDLKDIQASDTVGIADILKSQGIGFWFLSGRATPLPNQAKEQTSIQQYISLFQKQLGADSIPITRAFGSQAYSVTVSPSTYDAAKAVNSNAGGSKGGNGGTSKTKGILGNLMNSLKNLFNGGGGWRGKIDAMLKAAAKLDPTDKGGKLTKAGVALDKHGSGTGKRTGTAFPKPKGSAADKNGQGQSEVEKILNDPGTKESTKPNRFGGRDYTSPSGKGVRYDGDGNFVGFLQP